MSFFYRRRTQVKKKVNVPEQAYSQKASIYKERPTVRNLLTWAYVDPELDDEICLVHGTDYSVFTVFKFRGPDLNSATDIELMQYNNQLNTIFKSLPTGFVLYFEAQRHQITEYDTSDMPTPLLQMMEDERHAYYTSQSHYDSDYFFIVYQEPPAFLKKKITSLFIKNAKKKDANKLNLQVLLEFEDRFKDRASQIYNQLRPVFKDLSYLSPTETVTYLHNIVSDHLLPNVEVNPSRYVLEYVADSAFLGGRQPKLGNKFMKIITILNFPPMSSPGLFDRLNALNIEYRWVSRFICLSKLDAEKELANYQDRWSQQIKGFFTRVREAIAQHETNTSLNQTAIGNIEDVANAQIELGQEAVSYGYYTMAIIVMDVDKQQCDNKANMLLETINNMGFTGYIETDNSMEAWRGTLPGCYRCNIRRPIINSLNFCHLAPATAMWSGDKNNAHLQGPVLIYTDSFGYTPFRLSLHVRDVGHTMIVGPSGSGKSVLLNTLEAHFLKYPNSNIFIFDKAASSRCLTYAVSGNFYNLAAEDTGELSFQPLAHIDEESELNWAKEWLLSYLKSKNLVITPQHETYVWNALKSLQSMPQPQRTLSIYVDLVQAVEIRQALAALTIKGSYGRLFENDHDFSGSGRWQVYEMEALMNTPAIVPPTLEYLFHRIEKRINNANGPGLIVLDECWLFLDNDAFRNKL